MMAKNHFIPIHNHSGGGSLMYQCLTEHRYLRSHPKASRLSHIDVESLAKEQKLSVFFHLFILNEDML